MHIIKFPIFLTIRYAKSIIEKCQQAISTSEKDILFDFSNCGFCDPFAISLIVGVIKSCIAKEHNVTFNRSKNVRLESYLNAIGFYNWGAGIGRVVKFPDHTAELRHFKAVDPTYTQSVIRVLKGSLNLSQGVQDSLHMSINEMMTNTFDHSKSVGGCLICAQAFTTRGNVSICIADFGIGIHKALKSVEQYSYIANSLDAIKLAIQEGVSSRIGVRAGLGLAHIHKFLKINEGQMHIISGDAWVNWDYKPNGVTIKEKVLKIAFDGTIVNIIARADAEGLYILSSENVDDQIF
ncbi:MAG: hypothetical protein WDA22_01645 [Bacteroidota bacterium]